jgi:hypothetical protein
MRATILMALLLVGAGAVLVPPPVRAASADTRVRREYADIFERIRQGDQSLEQGDLLLASNQYVGALVRLVRLQQRMPQWETNLVTFRVEYLRKLLAGGLLQRAAPVARQPVLVTNLALTLTANHSYTEPGGNVMMTGRVQVTYINLMLQADLLTFFGAAARAQQPELVGIATGLVRLCVLNTQSAVASNAMLLARGDQLRWGTNGVMELSGTAPVLMQHGSTATRMRGLRYDAHRNTVTFLQRELTTAVPDEELRTLTFDNPVQEKQ